MSFFDHLKLLLILTLLWGCVNDEPEQQNQQGTISISGSTAYVCNEGNFQFGNASVSLLNTEDSSVLNQVYQDANGVALGDVCQSIAFFSNKAYIVVNNSSKIVVCNENDLTRLHEISGLESPRHFLPISNSKAYVSDLYANQLHVLDLNSNSKVGSVKMPGWTEEMLLAFGKAYVTCRSKPYLYVIESHSDEVVDSIQIELGAGALVKDKFDRIWVSCSKGIGSSQNSNLFCIDPISNQVINQYSLNPEKGSISHLELTPNKDSILFLNEHVYKMDIESNQLPSEPLISSEGRIFYSFSVNPKSGDILLSDAIDYNQRGNVLHFTPKGSLVNSYQVGIIPGFIGFR